MMISARTAYLPLWPQGRAIIQDRVLIYSRQGALIRDRHLHVFLFCNRMFKTKLEDEIICLKELYTHMDIINEKFRQKPLFLLCGMAYVSN